MMATQKQPRKTKTTKKVKVVKTADVSKNEPSEDVLALNEKIYQLEKELNKIDNAQRSSRGASGFFKGLAVFVLILISTICLFLINYSFWIKNTIMDNKSFVETTAPIIQDSEVQKVVSNNLSAAIFDNINVEEQLKNNLPQQIQFLAPVLSSQIRNQTTNQIDNILASPQTAKVWSELMATAQKIIISYIENGQNNGSITVNTLYNYAGQQLSDSSIGFVFNRNIPSRVGQIEITNFTWLPQARQYINILKRVPQVLSLVLVIALVAALLIANRKRHLLMVVMPIFIVTILFSLLVTDIAGMLTVNAVKVENKKAVEAIFGIVTNPLHSQTVGLLSLLVAAYVGLIITGPYKWVRYLVEKFRVGLLWLAGKLPHFKSPKWLLAIANYRNVTVYGLSFIGFAVFAFRLPPSQAGVVTASVITVVVILIMEIIFAITSVPKHIKKDNVKISK